MINESNRAGQANKATIYFIVGFIVLVTAAVIVAAAYSGGANSTTASSTFVATTVPAISSVDWQEGNPNAKVSLIEYGDFECPACGEYFPVLQQLFTNFSSTVLFVFRNFPLTTIHPFAQIGSQAAEAAGMEGGQAAYWKMHDLLYTNQTAWSTDTTLTPADVVSKYFDGYAQSIGLNTSTFNTDINSTQVTSKIQTDVTGGNAAQIDHTPTFFINLQQIPNPQSYNDFVTVINNALASSTALVATSTPLITVTSTSGNVGVSGIIVTTSSSQ
jgi:protein-disulfide isomerase